jgi:hypothetical protein
MDAIQGFPSADIMDLMASHRATSPVLLSRVLASEVRRSFRFERSLWHLSGRGEGPAPPGRGVQSGLPWLPFRKFVTTASTGMAVLSRGADGGVLWKRREMGRRRARSVRSGARSGRRWEVGGRRSR